MKIAINISPLKSAHKTRGIGYYTDQLTKALEKDEAIEIQKFTKLSEVKDTDLVHYPWFDLFFHTLPIKKSYPTVVTVHDVMPLLFPDNYPVGLKGKINFVLQRIALRSCRQIITDSEASKNDIVRYLKVGRDKIFVVPLAVDPNFKSIDNDTRLLHYKRQFRLPNQFLLYVGDANWVKNLPFLIEGFKQLLERPGLTDLRLVLVGGVFLKDVENIDHPELASLKDVNRLIKQYRLEDRIIRPGQIKDDELIAFYNLASLYVQPSLYEGFGLPVLQALACGTPVVSSEKGSLAEVGGQAVIYFDPANLKQFVSIVEEVLEDKSLQRKLSKLGFEQAAKFSWDKVAEETKLVYERAVHNV